MGRQYSVIVLSQHSQWGHLIPTRNFALSYDAADGRLLQAGHVNCQVSQNGDILRHLARRDAAVALSKGDFRRPMFEILHPQETYRLQRHLGPFRQTNKVTVLRGNLAPLVSIGRPHDKTLQDGP